MNFFRIVAPWSAIAKDKVGVESLRDRLKEILAGLIKTEFPKVSLPSLLFDKTPG